MIKQSIELEAGESIKLIFPDPKGNKIGEVIISRCFNSQLKIESTGMVQY